MSIRYDFGWDILVTGPKKMVLDLFTFTKNESICDKQNFTLIAKMIKIWWSVTKQVFTICQMPNFSGGMVANFSLLFLASLVWPLRSSLTNFFNKMFLSLGQLVTKNKMQNYKLLSQFMKEKDIAWLNWPLLFLNYNNNK